MRRASWKLQKPFWMIVTDWISNLISKPVIHQKKIENKSGQIKDVKIKYPHENWDYDETYDSPMFI